VARRSGVRVQDAQAVLKAKPAEEEPDERALFLASGAPPEPPAFSEPASLPEMDWIARPTHGWLAGTVRDAGGSVTDGAVVTAKRVSWFARRKRTLTDGNGFFGFADLQPGRYKVYLENEAKPRPRIDLEIAAGRVARVELISPE